MSKEDLCGRAINTTLERPAMSGLLGLIVALVVAGLVFWLVMWFVDWVGVPEPFNKIIKVVVGLFVLIYLIGILMGAAPAPLMLGSGHSFSWR